ncbi:XRE family transcriptional regulator [Sporosarcina newyorkensis 2681]|uniref:XRE family transcriptional regulator n=1 Tax=Sporosarcina newyorkensis 2681 TaxID=1027292 RepID=F9DR57_9BACL|nr:helix-turn-helix transcriptional regulator [Sporosarcina newyorkensis]EGQ26746.1 XRE family transcriptional regulator [Sporosarcina newyorkensis 2681]
MTFGEYLKKLREERSISQRALAEKSGISNAEISRIETGNRQNPSPDVLRQLAPVLEVPYEVLMEKAGYISEHAIARAENREAEERFISIIVPKLVLKGWGVEHNRRTGIGDIIAKRGNEEWHIDFRYFRSRADDDKHFRADMQVRRTLQFTYGRLAMYDRSPITEFTIAVNDLKAYEAILKNPPLHLNLKVSAMHVDLEQGEITTDFPFYED